MSEPLSPDPIRLSIVIPTLDAEADLARTLAHLAAAGGDYELVIADGGSRDGTRAIATAEGAQWIESAPGRGCQLAAGADAAAGDWLLFLHADTRLTEGWRAAIDGFMADSANAERAAAFRFAVDDNDPRARRLERWVAWRCRALALPYGDQGLLIAQEFYQTLGGYQPLPLMEDVNLIRRIGRRRLTMLDVPALTSAARFRRDGYLRRSARNLLCLALYFLGVPARLIKRLYA